MIRISLCSLVVALVASCGAKSSPSTTPTTASAPADDHCPMVEGTSVAVEDTATGAAMVFSSTGDRAALRDRVATWAARHNEHHGAMGPLPTGDEAAGGGHDHGAMQSAGGGHDHGAMQSAGGGHDHGAMQSAGGRDHGAMIGVHSRVEVSDTEQGVRLTFVTFPDQVAALQAELRVHAEHLTADGCRPHGAH